MIHTIYVRLERIFSLYSCYIIAFSVSSMSASATPLAKPERISHHAQPTGSDVKMNDDRLLYSFSSDTDFAALLSGDAQPSLTGLMYHRYKREKAKGDIFYLSSK